ncbi:MAG: hypothetical protein QOG91_440 [Candidatus Parcubacteria bacterium]|jgi:MFS family permease|nr:hypothetical protein [Candidatus Parcubacteria bacterium]
MPELKTQTNEPRPKILGLDRNIFMLGLTSFFNDFSNEMILSAFPAFFTSVLKAGAASLGLVEGIADGASNLLKIYSGGLSDRIGKRRIFIFIGYGLSVIIRPFYMMAGTVAPVLGLRVVDRIGKGLREAPRDVIISASATEGEIGRSFGYHRAMDAAGAILGPLGAYIILANWPGGFDNIFMTAFILGLISVATIFFVSDISTARTASGARLLSRPSFLSLPLSFRVYLSAIFLLSVGSLPVAVLLLKTTSIGLLIASIPLFYMIYSLSYAAFSYFAGKLSDTLGTVKVIVFGYVILIVSYALLGIAESAVSLALAFVMLGIFSASTDATQRAFTGRMVRFEERGTAYGLLTAALGFGGMLAGITGGYIWQAYSPAAALIAGAVMVALGVLVLILSLAMAKQRVY